MNKYCQSWLGLLLLLSLLDRGFSYGQVPISITQSGTESGTSLISNQVRVLTPTSGITGERSTNLIIQYQANLELQITVNGQPLDPTTPTTLERDREQNLITQVWYNIPLLSGDNRLEIRAGDRLLNVIQLTVQNTTNQINIEPLGEARISADHRSTVILGGKVTDLKGNPITQDTLVTLTTTAGDFLGGDYDRDRPGFQILAVNGQFQTRLRSSLEAQKVRVRASIEEGNTSPIEAYTQVEFIPNLRPSLVSGVVTLRIGERGLNFWGSRRDFLNPNTLNQGSEIDLSGAIFATGRVGEWLFTGAYNSDRPLNLTCDGGNRLFRDLQFCDRQYPVYGDSSRVDTLTPSIDQVYARLERPSPVPGAETDYVQWGDYNSRELGRDSQQITATTRQLHGFKANYSLGNLQLTALYSPNIEGFQRDTIPPDGTGGYYFLSRRLVVQGSETIVIETQELNRPGTILESQTLRRGTDYEIDYDRGAILFRQAVVPIKFDPFGNSLTRQIVATYQYEGRNTGDTNLYAGRLQYNFSQDITAPSFLAFGYIREEQGARNAELFSTDLMIPVGRSGRLVGEYGYSRGESIGSAYRVEFVGKEKQLVSTQVYYQSVDTGYQNNATRSFTPGQTRYGAVVGVQIGEQTRANVRYDREINSGTAPQPRTTAIDLFNPGTNPQPGARVDNDLTTIQGGVQQQLGSATLGVDYIDRHRRDFVTDSLDRNSSQIVTDLNVPLGERISFRAKNELSLGGNDPLYPDRTTLGLNWLLSPDVTIQIAHQFQNGGILGENSITSFSTVTEREWGENTSLTSRYTLLGGMNGLMGQSALGLNHRLVISPGLTVNFGYEQIEYNLTSNTAAGSRSLQPYTPGQSSSSLGVTSGQSYRVGLDYTTNPNFLASARWEYRHGSTGDNTLISVGAAGKVSPALTTLVRFQQASAANQLLEGLGNTSSLKVGLAYRNPEHDRFNGLLSYEYRFNPALIPDNLLEGRGNSAREMVFATEGIYAPSWRWEFYGKYALKYSLLELSRNFTTSTAIHLGQLRATYRLGYQWDLALEGRAIFQPSTQFSEWGWITELGYYLSPNLRVGLGYSFGSVDDRDFSGFRSQGGLYLGVTYKLNELFNRFGLQMGNP